MLKSFHAWKSAKCWFFSAKKIHPLVLFLCFSTIKKDFIAAGNQNNDELQWINLVIVLNFPMFNMNFASVIRLPAGTISSAQKSGAPISWTRTSCFLVIWIPEYTKSFHWNVYIFIFEKIFSFLSLFLHVISLETENFVRRLDSFHLLIESSSICITLINRVALYCRVASVDTINNSVIFLF